MFTTVALPGLVFKPLATERDRDYLEAGVEELDELIQQLAQNREFKASVADDLMNAVTRATRRVLGHSIMDATREQAIQQLSDELEAAIHARFRTCLERKYSTLDLSDTQRDFLYADSATRSQMARGTEKTYKEKVRFLREFAKLV